MKFNYKNNFLSLNPKSLSIGQILRILSLKLKLLILFLMSSYLDLKLKPNHLSKLISSCLPKLSLHHNPLALSLPPQPLTLSLNQAWPSLKLSQQKIRTLPLSWNNTLLNRNARLTKRRNTYLNCSATRNSSRTCCIKAQSMGGMPKTFTHGAITRGQPSLCLRSKTVTASAASPKLSGNLLISLLVIVMRCCSTCLANVTSPTKEKEKRYGATQVGDLVMVTQS
jgi:hypothetical protein